MCKSVDCKYRYRKTIVGIFFGLVGIAYLKASTLDSLAILTSLFLAIYEINLVR